MSYLEDLDSNVQAVSVDGQIKVDSNASERYNAESVNDNVNLINRNDTGRLVQQSYYGTLDYDHGVYMDNDWRYNPVQGGNQFNDASKIVDLRVTDTEIYIKCRPLDWAKEKEYITPSYMEATYSLEDGAVHAKCRFVDFSGWVHGCKSQELPAFYTRQSGFRVDYRIDTVEELAAAFKAQNDLGMKGGMLVGALFPLCAVVLYAILRKRALHSSKQ